MAYFVTGATGFIGRYLVERLLARGERVFVLVRPQSMQRFEALREFWGARASRAVPIQGNLAEPNLGVSKADLRRLTGKVDHLFHLAAIYDLQASNEAQDLANIVGTDHALQFADSVQAGCFHHTSSIAAAGLYRGSFREDMFEEATGLEHPYFRTKHESEALVRDRSKRPWRVYRPGIVVGHSQTGHIDKVDGPYYFFKMIQKLRQSLPPWFPLVGLEGGYINLVPVDYVVAAMDHLAHLPGQDGQCFHLTDPRQRRVGEVLNLFARAGHAPTMAFRVDPKLIDLVPAAVTASAASYRPLQQVVDTILRDLRIPRDVMQFFNWQTRFDCTRTQRLLEGTDIRVPVLEDYAWRLWDYWERHLDPDLRSIAASPAPSGARSSSSPAVLPASGSRRPSAASTRARRSSSSHAIRRSSRRRARGLQSAEPCSPTPATSRTTRPATVSPGRFSRSTAAWISSSTTPGVRSAVRSTCPPIASTTSSERCSSITSPSCASRWT